MASIRDVAARAGVSITTVSRVLHPDPHNKISPRTRERVQRAMKELGYEPRPTGRKAASPGAFRAGCIINSTLPKFYDRFYMTILSAFEEEIARLGGELSFIRTVREVEAAAGRLEATDYVLTMEYLGDALLRAIRAQTRGVAGADIEDGRLDRVGYDRLRAAALATEYLIGRGHRRIAYIGGGEYAAPKPSLLRARIDDGRFVGYQIAMRQHGLVLEDALARDCGWSQELCEAMTREMMTLPVPPTAILAASDNMAVAAISACGKLGLRVPGDVSVMGISDIEGAQFTNPPLTTVRVPQKAMGAEAARLLVLGQPSALPRLICFPTEVVERESVRDVGEGR